MTRDSKIKAIQMIQEALEIFKTSLDEELEITKKYQIPSVQIPFPGSVTEEKTDTKNDSDSTESIKFIKTTFSKVRKAETLDEYLILKDDLTKALEADVWHQVLTEREIDIFLKNLGTFGVRYTLADLIKSIDILSKKLDQHIFNNLILVTVTEYQDEYQD